MTELLVIHNGETHVKTLTCELKRLLCDELLILPIIAAVDRSYLRTAILERRKLVGIDCSTRDHSVMILTSDLKGFHLLSDLGISHLLYERS